MHEMLCSVNLEQYDFLDNDKYSFRHGCNYAFLQFLLKLPGKSLISLKLMCLRYV